MKFFDDFSFKVFGIRWSESLNLQKVGKNTIWLFFDNVVRLGVGFVLGVWLARYLGPEKFGVLNYAIAFVSIFSVLGMLGLDSIVLRNIVKVPVEKDKILGTAFALRIGGSIAAVSLCFIVSFIMNPHDLVLRWIIGILAIGITFQSFDVIDLYFQSQLQSRLSIFAKNSCFLLISIIKIIFILNAASLFAFTCLIAAETIIGGLALCFVYSLQGFSLKKLDFSWETAASLLGESWPLLLSGLLGIAYMKIDSILIGQMLSMGDLGQFSLACWVVETLFFVPVIINRSFSVKLFEFSKDSYFREIFAAMNLVSYSIILCYFIFSPVIKIFFGVQFQQAFQYMNLLIVNVLLLGLALPRGAYLIKIKKTNLYFIIELMGLILNLMLNFILIKHFQVYGVITSKILTFLFIGVLANLIFKETRQIFFEQLRSLFFIRGRYAA